MSEYITRFEHFTIKLREDPDDANEEEFVITSERNDAFKTTMRVPLSLDVDDEEAVFEYVYTTAAQAYRSWA